MKFGLLHTDTGGIPLNWAFGGALQLHVKTSAEASAEATNHFDGLCRLPLNRVFIWHLR